VRVLKNFPYKKALVLGLARSGTAVAKLLLASGIQLTINDRSEEKTEEMDGFIKAGAKLVLGSHPISVLDGVEVIIKNPGIPYDQELLQIALERGIPILTDIELIQYVFSGSITGITGSNGKTTTTRLIEDMFRYEGLTYSVAGNIGTPVTEVAPSLAEDTQLILELSSFQLLGIENFKPHVSVLLNLYEAHLDYHKTRENYEEAKFNIFKNQDESDYLVYNRDDDKICEVVIRSKAKLIPFSQKESLPDGAWVKKGIIYYKDEKIIDRDHIVLAGNHHLENILASIATAKIHGISTEAIIKTLTSFKGVKHRLQFVEEIKERKFYNDSKATNMLATIKALESFDRPTILLAGGLDRGDDLSHLIPYLDSVKSMIVFGENAEKFIELAREISLPYKRARDVKEATYIAYEQSSKGDVILLSPASASWDQYPSFEERGDMFIHTVHKLS